VTATATHRENRVAHAADEEFFMTRVCQTFVAAVLIGAGAGCTGRVDVETVPIGTPVEVTRQDGGVVRGTLTARDDRTLRMTVGPAARSIPRDEIAGIEIVEGTAPPPLLASARFREFTVPEGTRLALRLDSSLASDTSRVEDVVQASLTEAVMVDGTEVLPADSLVKGVVTAVQPAGKVSGRASLVVRFRSISIDGRDETYALSAGLNRAVASTKGEDARTIGIPAAGGAVIGAILGGKKGAGIGATVGGGAGTAVVLATAGDDIRLPQGTALSVALDDAIDVRVPITR
jgi:hypothetical protein